MQTNEQSENNNQSKEISISDTTGLSIDELRKKWQYRFFEGFTGSSAVLFILTLIIFAIYNPTLLAIFLIVYSFFIVLKSTLHTIYTFYTFNNVYRWEKINWHTLLQVMKEDSQKALQVMNSYQAQYPEKLNWDHEWIQIKKEYQKNIDTQLQAPNQLFHIIFIPIYNESVQVLLQSIERIYKSQYSLDKIWLVIAREERAGIEFNNNLKLAVNTLKWAKVIDLDEKPNPNSVTFDNNKLTLLLTSHPSNLTSEIKGKGSNLDWAGRQVSEFADQVGLDEETTLITVLDCDSRPGKNFFQILSFRFCTTEDRHIVGFQPIPVFTNNYFDSTILSSIVATGTTLWNFVQTSLPEEIHHFANYSVSLKLLRQTNFWVKDLVSEDSLFFDKNYCELNGNYRSVPTFAYFESDVVQSDNFGEAIFNQYKQLRRWAYGGVEGFSYLGNRLFLQKTGKNVEIRKKIVIMYNEWVGHFFWSTMPFVFGFVIFLPSIFNTGFNNTVTASNLSFFSQWFSIISYFFLFLNSFVILHFIRSRLEYRDQKLSWHNYLDILLQIAISPVIFSFWFLPPIEAQIRGIFGWYLGFWVTPKK
jgi:Glycosyl transferase family group 2